ncbi:MAG: NADP-specific glutamate dehydrogenase [Alphaproteobacteria bacterium]|nr:NADP-specific glutamate dehydrogenase [Alphaproteobacteria bacterium]MCB9930442.1 NADP-specific glutamate dehydrogenase [Alphaproteobacteria bacterium]
MDWVIDRNPGETVFHQAVHEVAETVIPFINANPVYAKIKVLERMVEPDRVVSFRVAWADDNGEVQINRGYRVQFNNSIGPYKGGIRFHPSVNQGVLKFLGFEQTFKNSLTRLPMGGGKGGADFDPKGRSQHEIMRFCQSYMTELFRYVGPDVDVPAGDIGVGGREIGYMFGQYKRLTGHFNGVLTGKGLEYGGSLMRTEATGYGAVYFLEDMLHHVGNGIEGKTAVVSGSGNVATHAAEKVLHRGGKPVTLSDSGGFIHDPEGFSQEKIDWIKRHKAKRGARISAYVDEFGGTFHEGQRPWAVPCDVALPCATQNELDEGDARALIANGCKAVTEGANMPCTAEAVAALQGAGVLYAPGKASNAGGVGMSGLEMSQNSARLHREEEDLRTALRKIMSDIHAACVAQGSGPDGKVDYVKGANIAGFKKVADAMLAFGVV